jgi:hypothetical protein
MINLSWGGYTNGALPDTVLAPIDDQGHKLERAAAAKFLAMQAAMLHDLGRTINVAPGADSAFRTLAQQQADYDLYVNHNGNVAAYPGTSNHGWGRAVDITGYEVRADVWQWLLSNAGTYGFSWQTGQASGERWHWESLNTPGAVTPASTTAAPITLEAIMALKDSVQFFTNPTRGVFLGGPAAWLPIDNRDGIDGQHKIDLLNKYVGAIPVTVVPDVSDWDVLNQTFKDWALASTTGK